MVYETQLIRGFGLAFRSMDYWRSGIKRQLPAYS